MQVKLWPKVAKWVKDHVVILFVIIIFLFLPLRGKSDPLKVHENTQKTSTHAHPAQWRIPLLKFMICNNSTVWMLIFFLRCADLEGMLKQKVEFNNGVKLWPFRAERTGHTWCRKCCKLFRKALTFFSVFCRETFHTRWYGASENEFDWLIWILWNPTQLSFGSIMAPPVCKC